MIVVAYQARTSIVRCLESLATQSVGGFRVIVVDSSTDGTATTVRSAFPTVEVARSTRRLFPGDARNLGLQRTSTPLVAFLDADCIAAPDWAERILAAHSTRDQWIIGGSVGVANAENLVGWALYFCEFSTWIRRGKARSMADIPTCCLSFRREALDELGPFLEGTYASDTQLNWKAGQAGHPPWFDPSIHVRHINPVSVAAVLRKLGMHGKTFACVRARHWRWTALGRLSYAAAAVLLLPLVLWLRVAYRVLDAPPGYRGSFLRATPFLWAALLAWSWGEAAGYLAQSEE